jgi:tRNA-(ms[2]io[6]A)-hydroxylase
MAELNLHPIANAPDTAELTPLAATPEGWIEIVLADFDAFLQDHASAEKKASGMALSMVSHYPDQTSLVAAMVDLAVEELNHYKEVMRLLMTRGVTPAADRKDPYVTRLNKLVRKDSAFFLLDRLLIGAIVERRGAERFGLVAKHIDDAELRKFYHAIAKSEARHWHLFVTLSRNLCPHLPVDARFCELAELENALVAELPLRPALH